MSERHAEDQKTQKGFVATLCATMFNSQGAKKKSNKKGFSASDFLIEDDKPEKTHRSGDDMLRALDRHSSQCGLNNQGEYEAQQLAKAAVN